MDNFTSGVEPAIDPPEVYADHTKTRKPRDYRIMVKAIAMPSLPQPQVPTFVYACDDVFPGRAEALDWIKKNGIATRAYLPCDSETISVSSRTKEIRSLV